MLRVVQVLTFRDTNMLFVVLLNVYLAYCCNGILYKEIVKNVFVVFAIISTLIAVGTRDRLLLL